MTYFHAKKIALSSALERFTDLFGMGRGGSTPLWSSDIGRLWLPIRGGSSPVRQRHEGEETRGMFKHLGYGLRRSITGMIGDRVKHSDDKCAVIGSSLTGN